MKTHRKYLGVFLFLAITAPPVLAQKPCADLLAEKLPHVTITGAAFMNDPLGFPLPETPGVFGTPDGLKVSDPFCRVIGFIEPVEKSHIGFEVWLPPAENWNSRFLAVSNPAFEGAIKYQGLASSLERGYATASTDTGHRDPGHQWALGQPEMLVDWVHRAMHETTAVAKQLIRAFYGKGPSYSYFEGCHNGGRQGLVEAQRYPEDFDGIVAGDPAFYLTRLQTGSEYINWVALKDGVDAPGFITPDKYAVLHRAALDACDTLDGVKDDAIEDPTRCRFDPASVQCSGPDEESCLTAAQVDTARKIYAGAKFADGTEIYSGFEPGSELYWGMMIQGPEPLNINNGFFQYIAFEDPHWDFRSFDLERDTRDIEKRLGPIIDNTNPDLSAFKQSGGKLLVYQSWNETWIPPRMITEYHDKVQKTMGGKRETDDFFRLFMVPDHNGCPGNPKTFNVLEALQKWREQDIAPDYVEASYGNSDQIYKTRPVCAYPNVAIYRGEGDINKAENFYCGEPTW
jgi:feruloyl esterase